MAYVTLDFLKTQFDNFAARVSDVFARKSDTYTKTEIDNKFAGVGTGGGLSFKKVEDLPTEDISDSVIYLVPKDESETNNIYTEYIYVDESWEIIGEVDAGSIDLDGYVTTEALNTTLADYLKKSDKETTDIDFSGFFAEEE